MLDDHIVMTQSMAFSPYKKPFEERIIKWEAQLSLVSGWQAKAHLVHVDWTGYPLLLKSGLFL
jgi:hypothetical protein